MKAGALAALVLSLTACSPTPAAAPTPDLNEVRWRACVEAAWYNDDPSDATLFVCDDLFGDNWTYEGPTYQEELTK